MLGIVTYSDSEEDDDCHLKPIQRNASQHEVKSLESDDVNKTTTNNVVGNDQVPHESGDKSESESDSDIEEQVSKTAELPLPDVFNSHQTFGKCVRKRKKREGDEHGGRKRTFDHVEGNWPTCVYVSLQHAHNFQAELDTLLKCLRQRFAHELHAFPLNSCHISVSRTVPIRHYWIEPMYEKLKLLLSGSKMFHFSFDSIRVYTNDEKTRTFVGFQISHGADRFLDLVEKTDQIYKDFDLPLYYSEPSFHASVAWLLGDRKDEIDVYLSKSGHGGLRNEILYQNVRCVCMKTGNKVRTVPLL